MNHFKKPEKRFLPPCEVTPFTSIHGTTEVTKIIKAVSVCRASKLQCAHDGGT